MNCIRELRRTPLLCGCSNGTWKWTGSQGCRKRQDERLSFLRLPYHTFPIPFAHTLCYVFHYLLSKVAPSWSTTARPFKLYNNPQIFFCSRLYVSCCIRLQASWNKPLLVTPCKLDGTEACKEVGKEVGMEVGLEVGMEVSMHDPKRRCRS